MEFNVSRQADTDTRSVFVRRVAIGPRTGHGTRLSLAAKVYLCSMRWRALIGRMPLGRPARSI